MPRDVTVRISATDSFSSVFDKYQAGIRKAATDTEMLGTASKTSTTAVNDIAGAMRTAMAVWGTLQLATFVGEIIDMGQQANVTETVFRQLTSTMGDYEGILGRVRAATGGIVDDMTLQEGANRMLQMGIAQTPAELERLMEMAVKLGGSLGMDPTKALSDFSLMLANNSIMRLDQFGISAGAVRARIGELKEEFEGIDRSRAFQLAVLEIGSTALTRLGDAADAASTPISRLSTTLQNLGQDFAQNVAIGANALMGIAEIALGVNPQQMARNTEIEQYATANAQVYVSTFMEGVNSQLSEAYQVTDQALATELLENVFRAQKADPSRSLSSVIEESLSVVSLYATTEQMQVIAGNLYTQLYTAMQAEAEMAKQSGKGLGDALVGETAITSRIASPAALAEARAVAKEVVEQAKLYNETRMAAVEYSDSLLHISNSMMDVYNTMGFSFNPQQMMEGVNPEALMPEYMTRDKADAVKAAYEEITAEVERLKELNKQDLITDAQLNQATTMSDNLKDMADLADKAADAFEKMTLSDVFGQTSGGMAGEIQDKIVEYMKSKGMDEDKIAEMEEMLSYTSGRTTDSSIALEKLIPELASLNPEQVSTAMMNLQAFLQQGALTGMDQDLMAKLLPYSTTTGANYFGGAFDQQLAGVMAEPTPYLGYGLSRGGSFSLFDQLSMIQGQATPYLNQEGEGGDMESAISTTEQIAGNVSTAAEQAAALFNSISSIPESKELKIKLTADDPQGILALFAGVSLAAQVRNNGGTVPGARGGGTVTTPSGPQ